MLRVGQFRLFVHNLKDFIDRCGHPHDLAREIGKLVERAVDEGNISGKLGHLTDGHASRENPVADVIKQNEFSRTHQEVQKRVEKRPESLDAVIVRGDIAACPIVPL